MNEIAQPRATPLPGTIHYDMTARESGLVYRVFVYVPQGEPPATGWPVLYLTDGNALIATAVDALRARSFWPKGTNVQPGVIVAVGYPTHEAYDPLRRSLDLGPPPGSVYPPFSPGTPDVRTGGAAQFLSFIEEQVKPLVADLAPLDPGAQTLFGHSFGGLFALFALFTRPLSFTRFVAASPSIYWEDAVILDARDRFLETIPEDLDAFVHLSAGEYEGDALAPFQMQADDREKRLAEKARTRTLALAREMADSLVAGSLAGTGAGRIETDFEVFARETHMTVLPVAVSRAIQIAFAIERE